MTVSLGDLFVSIGGDVSKLLKAEKQTDKILSKMSKNFTKMGKSLSLRVTAPLAIMGGLAVRNAIKFESAFTGVRKTVTATEKEFKQLEKELRDITKIVPLATTEIYGIGEAAGQLGIQTENIASFAKVMADLGATTNLAAKEAATQLARFANITRMSQGDFDRLGSSIVDLGNNFATTEAEIVAMSLRLASAGTQIGLTESEILGMAAALSSLGVRAELGGTAFSRVMLIMKDAVLSGSKSLTVFAKTAEKTVEEFVELYKTDASEAVLSFVEGLGKINEAGGNANAVIEEMGLKGIRLKDVLGRVAGASDFMRKAIDLSNHAWDKNVALIKEALLRYATTESKLKIFVESLVKLGATIGELILPGLIKMVNLLTPLIEGFNNLSGPTKTVGVILAAMAAAAGPLAIAFGLMLPALAAVVPLFTSLSVLTFGPLIALLPVILGIDKAFKFLNDKIDKHDKALGIDILTVEEATKKYKALTTQISKWENNQNDLMNTMANSNKATQLHNDVLDALGKKIKEARLEQQRLSNLHGGRVKTTLKGVIKGTEDLSNKNIELKKSITGVYEIGLEWFRGLDRIAEKQAEVWRTGTDLDSIMFRVAEKARALTGGYISSTSAMGDMETHLLFELDLLPKVSKEMKDVEKELSLMGRAAYNAGNMISDTLGVALFNVLKINFGETASVWEQMLNQMLRSLTSWLAEKAVTTFLDFLFGGKTATISGGGGGGDKGWLEKGWDWFKGLFGFEMGTSFVPETGLAVVHQGERIFSAKQNDLLLKILNSAINAKTGGNEIEFNKLMLVYAEVIQAMLRQIKSMSIPQIDLLTSIDDSLRNLGPNNIVPADRFIDIFGDMKEFGSKIWDGIQWVGGKLIDFGKGIFTNAIDRVIETGKTIAQFGKDIISGNWKGVGEVIAKGIITVVSTRIGGPILGGIIADKVSGTLFPNVIDPSFQGGGFRPPSGMSAEDAGLFSGANVPSISGAGGSIPGPTGPTVNINFNGTVIGDPASFENFSRDIMDQIGRISEETLDI